MRSLESAELVAGSGPLVLPERGFGVPRWIGRFVRQEPLGTFGVLLLIVLVVLAIFGPAIAPYGPNKVNASVSFHRPTAAHPMGTDQLGRDVYSRIVLGARTSIGIGVIATVATVIFGAIIGMISAWYGGWPDTIVQRLVDAFQAFPLIVLALGIVAVLGASVVNVIIAITFAATPGNSRVVRAATFAVKQGQFVEAAVATGASGRRIIWHHILPNVRAPIIILASLQIGGAIILEATLSFLGLGTPPPTPSWGRMLGSDGRDFLTLAPWLAIFPGLFISLAVLGTNVFGDALRDQLDPRLRASR
jgi:peptide/nickel transport system permease protein